MPRISVILPVYNASKYLLESLESLSSQSFDDFEIIAINDGSTDNSLQLLQEYSKKEHRLRIVSRINKGITKTLNEGIDLAEGEFIARMDADDISLPQRFEKQLNFLENNNIDICGTQYETFGSLSEISNMPINCEDCYLRLLLGFSIAHPSFFVKKSILSKYKYNEKCKSAQDYELCCRMALGKVKMGNCPDVLLKYRYSPNSISSTRTKEQNSFALTSSKKYWEQMEITQDIPYPLCVIDSLNNNLDDLKNSMKSLIELHKRLKDNNYMNGFIHSKQMLLLRRQSFYGLSNVLPFLKRIRNLNIKTKIIYSLMAITKVMKIKEYINKLLSNSSKQKIFTYLNLR